MKPLADILLAPSRKRAVVADLARLIEDQVDGIRGLRGISVRTLMAMVKRTMPDVLPRAVGRYAPEFVGILEPLYARHRQESDSGSFGAFLRRHDAQVTQALLAHADHRAHGSSNGRIKGYWQKFRGVAEEEVLRAVPALGAILDRHLA